MRIAGVVLSAGILMTSCVSSKKYKASQAEVAKLHADSLALAQEKSTLQQNLSTAEQKGTELQKSVESATTTNAGLQKNVAYYSDYAGKQTATTTQLKDELTTTLAASGITDQDIMQKDGKIYINVGEKSLFKGNSAVLSTKGKEMVNNLGMFVKSKEAVDVSIADLQMANSSDGTAEGGSAETTEKTAADMNSGNSNKSGSVATTATNNNADYGTTGTAVRKKKYVAPHHTNKVQAGSGESKAVAYSSAKRNKYSKERSNRMAARAIAWKRQNVIADALLQNGIPKVKLVSQLPGTNQVANSPKGVQVVLVHDMDNFYKHMSEAPAGQPVSKNP